MNIFKWVLVQLPLVMCLVLVPVINVSATDIPMYKGALRVLIVGEREGNTLLLQYRTKTRQVLRVGVRGVAMTNSLTHQVTRLPDASASLAAGLDAGDLHADIEYGGLNLTGDDYRVEGSLVVYLAGAQQTRNFRVYLKPRSAGRPANSSIDWGIDNPAR
jgi:hypothetical protein